MDHVQSHAARGRTLVIGAGQAGLQVASSLRELGDLDPITVVGGEAHLPYQRPPLSKAFLAGQAASPDLTLRHADFYDLHDIAIQSGMWIDSITLDDENGSSGTATTSDGETIGFSRLAFTLGGTPRRMSVPGADLAGIHYLRTIDDATALRAELDAADHVAIVGGGFIGLEIAATATAKGKDVTVLEALDRLMARAVAPEMSRFYADAHTRRGTRIELNATVTSFHGADGRVTGVGLSDGRAIKAEVVVVGIGLLPHTELASSIGLADARGIRVDQAGRTRIGGIVAAGDCALTAHPVHGEIRIESVPNAIAQAKSAAAALLGREPGKPPVPWFWSDQADLKLQMAGLSMGYDHAVVRGQPGSEQFSTLYYRDGEIVSVESVNSPRDYMTVRRILEVGGNIPVEAAGDLKIPLKDHLQR
ncbi:FAD-dependent oxidoreductase [Microbacterium pseudoresistens]|uniref:3-phenylpropionate/trans-cinnamate dioxygenase ferredoxin reductase subunit n=1 Tax=Microbacterium pseudoresistens TaxID=640634 RepID=A0A7Y9EW24_9MICO|nr:FAD-dependent oxidoreductase [Microbacterium pseudoresistens]NYD54881.1 3-phenylpropionate/trans-cinnamate dioxygenase ferredoxin reductase subunit [Microbacterium pseudoresistens]